MNSTVVLKKVFWSIMLLCLTTIVRANDLEYRFEVGGITGVSNYYGDANYNGIFKNINIMGGFVGRYNINPRMALKANLAVSKVSGNTADGDNRFPGGDVEFSRSIYDLGVQFEYNFFAYGNTAAYNRTRRFTPYVFAGIGLTYVPEPLENVLTMNIPIGAGVKYKIAPRWNVGCELSLRFSFSDNLDVTAETSPVLSDPYGIKSSGIKNKDSYSFFSIFFTYDIFPKYRKCNN